VTGPLNNPYERRFPDPQTWPSNQRRFADAAVEQTRERVNELSWEIEGDNLAAEIEQVLSGARPMPDSLPGQLPQRRRLRPGDPGE